MGPPSYKQSVVDRNVVMQHVTVLLFLICKVVSTINTLHKITLETSIFVCKYYGVPVTHFAINAQENDSIICSINHQNIMVVQRVAIRPYFDNHDSMLCKSQSTLLYNKAIISTHNTYRVSWEECARLRENVP